MKYLKFRYYLLPCFLICFSTAFAYAAEFTTTWINVYDVQWAGGYPTPFYWQDPLTKMDDCAIGFKNSLDDISTFSWGRSGSNVVKAMFEEPTHTYWVGDEDLHYHAGHGNPDGPAMWLHDTRAMFTSMELGPDLEWLAMCSCRTVGQPNPWYYFHNSFSEGLHAVMGGYNDLSISGDEGGRFADSIKDADTMKEAWLGSHDDGDGIPAVIFAGTSGSDCDTRMYNEKYWGKGTVYSDPVNPNTWCRLRRE